MNAAQAAADRVGGDSPSRNTATDATAGRLAAQAATDRVGSDSGVQHKSAQAATDRVGSGSGVLPDPVIDLVDVRYRPLSKRIAMAAAGATAGQIAAAIAADLDAAPSALTALSDDPREDGRCWVALGPDGPRLARIGGMDADTLNIAFAAAEAARIESPYA